MTTQRLYSYSLMAFLVVALLALGTGGCGNSGATARRPIETGNQVPAWVGTDGMNYAEQDAGMIGDEPTGEEYEADVPMGYREPGYSDTMDTGTVADDESSEAMTCYGEEETSTEGTEECDMDDGSTMPLGDEEEEGDPMISEDSGDETGEGSAVIEEDGTAPQTEDESYSDTVAPYIGGEDETAPDPNVDDPMSDTADDAPVGD
jgi:hypothetical protein